MKKDIKHITLLGFIFILNLNSFGQTKTNNEGILSIIGLTGTISEVNNSTTGTITNDGDFFVYNHYNNDGIVTFTNGITTGLTRMNGLFGFQNISGLNSMKWYNCEFNNTLIQPAFHLSNEIKISGNADFLHGIIDDDNYNGLVVFENLANHSNVDDDSHVDGYVQKNGDELFKFPIGNGGQYRHASISAPSNTTDAFTGKYFWENSNPLYPHANKEANITLIDNAEYWTIDKTAANSNVFLTLSWDLDTTPAQIYVTPYEEIHIVRWDAVQNRWIDEGGVADSNNKEVTTIINPLTSYGVFTLARVKSQLPCNGSAIVVYNFLSQINPYFVIEGIEECPNNHVEIYNRWGVKVFETNSYNTNQNRFDGYSHGRVTNNSSEKLPGGTYYYFIEFTDNDSNYKLSGFVYLD